MSYGVWRDRGKGWTALNIDTPGGVCDHATLEAYKYECYSRDKVGTYWFLIRGLERHGVDSSYYKDDYNYLKWRLSQKRTQPQRTVAEYSPGGGEHIQWISYEDEESLERALVKLQASDYDRQAIHKERV